MRPEAREAAAAETAVHAIASLAEAPHSALVALDPTGAVADALAARGAAVHAWQRFQASSGPGATPWPPALPEPAALATLRIPKGREALRMSLHAIAGRVTPGATILVYGANDEGIRSSGRVVGEVFDDPTTVEARRHCRVWRARARAAPAAGTSLDDWLAKVALDTPAGEAALWSAPGLFAHERLDAGTRLLLECLPDVAPDARVLDFGCGAGAIAWAVARREPRARLWLLDRDALATHVAARNVADATVLLGDGLAAAAGLRFDWILSNPPLHEGRATAPALLERFVRDAPTHLAPGGALRLVTHRTGPAGRLLADAFAQTRVLRETRSYRVWHASA